MAYNSLKMLGQVAPPDVMGAFQQGQQFVGQRQLADSLAGKSPIPPLDVYTSYNPEKGFALQQQQDMANREMQQKRELAMMKSDPTKKSVTDMEQLWKDTERSLRWARQFGSQEDVEYYQNLKGKIENQLKTMRPSIWGEQTQGQTTDGVNKPKLVTDYITNTLKSMIKDENNDGLIDNVADIKQKASKWARDNNIGPGSSEYKMLTDYISNLEDQFKTEYDVSISEEDRAISEARRNRAENRAKDEAAAKFGILQKGIKELKTNTESIGAKSSILTSILRDESGAAIAESEFSRRMMDWLTPTQYNRYINDVGSIQNVLLGMVDDYAREAAILKIVNNYLADVPANKIIETGEAIIPDYIKDSSNSGGNNSGGNKPRVKIQWSN